MIDEINPLDIFKDYMKNHAIDLGRVTFNNGSSYSDPIHLPNIANIVDNRTVSITASDWNGGSVAIQVSPIATLKSDGTYDTALNYKWESLGQVYNQFLAQNNNDAITQENNGEILAGTSGIYQKNTIVFLHSLRGYWIRFLVNGEISDLMITIN